MVTRKEIMRGIKTSLSNPSIQKTEVPRELEEPQTISPEAQPPTKSETVGPEIQDREEPSVLLTQFDSILNNIENKMGIELSASLERFQSEYVKQKGYNSVLKNIHNKSNDLKQKTEVLSPQDKENLKISMKFWKQKLDL